MCEEYEYDQCECQDEYMDDYDRIPNYDDWE